MRIALTVICCTLFLSCTGSASARSQVQAGVSVAGFSEDKEGESALDLEDYARAETIFRNLVAAKVGATQEGYARTGLGESLLWQGRFSEAAKELKKASGLVDKTQPAASDLRARVYDDLAWLDQTRSDLPSAIANVKTGLAALHDVPNADPNHMCELLEHLGTLCKESGLFVDAADYYRQSMLLKVKAFGEQSIQAADAKECLAMLLRKTGNTNDATTLYNQALQIKSASPAAFTPYAPHVYSDTVVYRFYQGAPNCGLLEQHGVQNEAINIAGLTVSAALAPGSKALGKSGCVRVSLVNETSNSVQLLPKPPEVTVLAPKVVLSHLVDAGSLAAKVEKKGEKSAKWVRFWGKDSTMPVTTTYIGHPGVWGYSPVTSYNNVAPIINRSGNMTTVTSQVPDYVAQQRALEKAANIEGLAREQADTIRGSSIGATTVPAGGNISGSLYFDQPNLQKSIVQIPVGNAVFEFRFPPGS